MASGKKSKTKKAQRNAHNSSSQRQLKSVIWFTVSVFLICVVFIKGENWWTDLHNFMFGLFGITAFFYPFYLAAISVLYAMNKLKETVGKKIQSSGILVLLIAAAINIFASGKKLAFTETLTLAYKNGIGLKNGGFFGALVGEPIRLAFGKTGAAITIILLIFVFLMIISGTTLIALFKNIKKSVKTISEQAESVYQEHIEKAENGEDTANDRKKKIKVLKGFNVDIPVDDITEEREINNESLEDKQRKVINTYYEQDRNSNIQRALRQQGRSHERKIP